MLYSAGKYVNEFEDTMTIEQKVIQADLDKPWERSQEFPGS